MAARPRRVVAAPMDREAFAPFGELLTAPAAFARRVNLGTAGRADRLATLENTRESARPNVALFRCDAQTLPRRITLLERHPHSTQLFAALRGGEWLLVVAPNRADGGPDEGALRAFRCPPGSGVNLRRGVWHHPVLAIGQDAELLMLAWEDGGAGDCEERPLGEPVEVSAG
ncbi:MAG: ureidoglycolate lyase [Candidatus Eisenbacteria bacterium]|nr:ureidoglycolate lyase [Candidatus Eisenbacteria bacterium]